MNNISFNRQVNLIKYSNFEGKTISIVGCGAIGSNLALALAKVGFGQPKYGKLKLFDFDEVSGGNIANQNFFPNQIGKLKVECTKENLAVYGCTNVEAYNEKVTSEDVERVSLIDANIIIMCVDSNDSRRDIMENIVKYCRSCECVIETGMSLKGVKVQYHCNVGWNKVLETWLKSWKPSSEQTVSACGISETAYPTVIASVAYAMGIFMQHYNKFWSMDIDENMVEPISYIDADCYNFSGIIKKSGEDAGIKCY